MALFIPDNSLRHFLCACPCPGECLHRLERVVAILIGEQLLADQERVLGPDHPNTLAVRNNLANAYQAAGRTTRRRILGPDHPDTMNSRGNLAAAYSNAGRNRRGERFKPRPS